MLLLHGAHPDWSAKVEQVSVCGQSGSELPQQPGRMTPRTSFRKHILLNLSHNIYYKLYLKSSWQCNLCDECLPFLWYNEYLMPPGSLCEVTSEITLKGRSKIVVCYQIVLSKRAWSRHILFSGVTSWKNKRLEEPSFHIFFFFFLSADLFIHALKDVLIHFVPRHMGELSAILFYHCQIFSKQPGGPHWYTDTVFVQISLFTACSLN